MELKVRSYNGQFEAILEGKGQDDLFEQTASFQEVFDTSNIIKGIEVPDCDIRFAVRMSGEDKYYEKRYVGSDKTLRGFKMEYHCRKSPKGALYVETYLKSDEDKANYEDGGNGWRRWKGGKAAPVNAATVPASKPAVTGKDEVPF